MKKTLTRIALIIAVPACLLLAAIPVTAAPATVYASAYQGSDLEARVAAVEKRINAIKATIDANAQLRSHRGAVASLENRKNNVKFKLKSADAAAKAQLESDLKELEAKVTELEGTVNK